MQPNAPLLRQVGERPSADLLTEHAALARWLGRLQRRISNLQQAHQQQVTALEAELMRLRGQALVLRTATLWGLGGAVLAPPSSMARVPGPQVMPPMWREVSEVICQTGCAGHAHPWRDEQGLCRRTGEVCQPVGKADVEAPEGHGSERLDV